MRLRLRWPRRGCWLAVLAGLATASAAQAQAYQCAVPERIVTPREVRPDGPRRQGTIGGYTLALSWSPEFCRGRKGRDSAFQCGGAGGRFGFILHGLWPESRRGPPPQWCALTPRPRESDYLENLCMTPTPFLIGHEWAKHGSCMSPTPAAYWKASRILWQSLRLPDADRLSRQAGLTVGDLRKAFSDANPAVPRDAIGVVISNGGWLREIRLCYGSDFLPHGCQRQALGPRDTVPLKIWRGL